MSAPISHDEAFQQLCAHQREVSLLHTAMETLEWDQRTKMPEGAGEHRAEQVTLLASLAHQRSTSPQVGQWLESLLDSPLAADPHSDSGTTIRQVNRNYRKQIRVPEPLVQEMSRTASLGQHAWVEARRENDFAKFLPWLEKTISLKRQYADAVGFDDSPYDALLDDYEPQQTTAQVSAVLAALKEDLVPLVSAIVDSGRAPDRTILRRHYPAAAQQQLGIEAAEAIGFDFARGRVDETHHPFCTTLGPRDVRLTTRYDEHFLPTSLFGTLHEAGHGIYEQGLRAEQFGLPPGDSVSLGIHESQSRLWENIVGRSRPFWQYFYPRAQAAFPEALGDVPRDAFCQAINDVQPSLIRVEADEATYNLHIIIRFELEQALISGQLAPADAPAAWNEKYRQYLGIEPPDDADGVMQDVHWSAGLIGYFPTYSLGNLYSAQLYAAADRELGGCDEQLARGQFDPLRQWLTENVYRHGQCYRADELVQRASGQPLSHRPLIDYLRSKYEQLEML